MLPAYKPLGMYIAFRYLNVLKTGSCNSYIFIDNLMIIFVLLLLRPTIIIQHPDNAFLKNHAEEPNGFLFLFGKSSVKY